MGRTLFLHMVLRKFIEFTNNKPVFSQYNTFYKYKYFFLESVFWSLFNNRQKGQSNQEQWSLCCSLPGFCVLLWTHYGPLQWFSTCFCKSKEFGVLGPIFPDYLISCDYGENEDKFYRFYESVQDLQIIINTDLIHISLFRSNHQR